MKTILVIILSLFAVVPLIAQESTEVDNKIYRFTQTKAMPKEGLTAFHKTFISKFKSEGLTTAETELNLMLEFVVEKDGTFTNIRLIKGDEEAHQEAIRVLKTMPAWTPATHDGKAVRSIYVLPIKLILKNNVKEDQSIRSSTTKVETDFFEFECNQCSIRETGMSTVSYIIDNEYNVSEFRIDFTQVSEDIINSFGDDIDEMLDQVIFDEINGDPDITFKDIRFLNMSIKEFGAYSSGLRYPYEQVVFFYKNGYIVSICASASTRELAVKNMNTLKQTFKLKI